MQNDLIKALLKIDRNEARFLAKKLSRILEKNRYHLFFDRQDELTELGEILTGIYEIIFVFGVLKIQPKSGGENIEE